MEMDLQEQEDTNITPGEDGDILNKAKHEIGAGKEYNRQELMREQVVDVLGV